MKYILDQLAFQSKPEYTIFMILGVVPICGCCLLLWSTFNRPEVPVEVAPTTIEVADPAVSTRLPLFVAMGEELLRGEGLKIEPVWDDNANKIGDAIVVSDIQATSVCADSPWLSMALQ